MKYLRLSKMLKDSSIILDKARQRGIKISTAESCTGGMLSAALTSIPGSSDVFTCGFVTYSNESKSDILRVDKNLIIEYGAVSHQVAMEMALQAKRLAKSDISVSITGIAGPSGATKKKPIGLVYFGLTHEKNLFYSKINFKGTRDEIRTQATLHALSLLHCLVEDRLADCYSCYFDSSLQDKFYNDNNINSKLASD